MEFVHELLKNSARYREKIASKGLQAEVAGGIRDFSRGTVP